MGTSRKRSYRLPVPFGWFAVARGEETAPGELRILKYFDSEFVLWRGQDGALRATDPYCRHLGAHLGHGGIVVENDIQCPFHFWRYDGTGAVTNIPYATIMPKRCQKPGFIGSWPITEANGLIYAWYHPQKAPPLWQPDIAPEIAEQGWVGFERHEREIAVHIQEITKNGIDYPHFFYIHGVKSTPKGEWKLKGYRRNSLAKAKMETPRGLVDGVISSNMLGPGQGFVRFSGIADVLLVNSLTPIDRGRTQVRFDFYHPPGISEGAQRVSRALARNITHQLAQDTPIWENKRYEARPVLCNGDGPILAYRRQYAQYYVGKAAGALDEAAE